MVAKQRWTTSIEQLEIEHYRKFSEITIPIKPGLNVVAGENGIGKSSILYLISNAFQKVRATDEWITDSSATKVLQGLSERTNLKIESLVRGSRYSDPASGYSGGLYKAVYSSGRSLSFRRHNTSGSGAGAKVSQRYRLAPSYDSNSEYGLPATPVVYLGLSRLIPLGELVDEKLQVKRIQALGESDSSELVQAYKKLTGLELKSLETVRISDIKSSAHFDTDKEGVDSNTISAGQDNMFVILYALQALKAYAKATDKSPSLLLIDELDASLHPALQTRLMDILREASREFSVQVVFTTHSFTILEEALRQNDNVLYLQTFPDVRLLEDPTMEKAQMDLLRVKKQDLLVSQKIFVLTEDQEARDFLEIIFDAIEKMDTNFQKIRSIFEFIELSTGAELLRDLFRQDDLWARTPAFAVLDGDQPAPKSLADRCIVMPGNDSPEKLLINYGKELISSGSDFWTSDPAREIGFSHYVFEEQILDPISEKLNPDGTTKTIKKPREIYKQVYTEHRTELKMLARHWVENLENRADIEKFAGFLSQLFAKNAGLVGRSPTAWQFKNNGATQRVDV